MTGDNADQSAVIDLLARPQTHGTSGPVERIDTHISHLFLAGERACKLKRAVRFPYLDFSTRAARRAACAAEVRLNRRTAPDLYLGVAPVLRGADGALRLGAVGSAAGAGETVADWVVVMRRFDQAMLFDAMAMRGALTAPLVEALADEIAAFHEKAAPAPGFGGAAGMGQALDGILAEIARFTPRIFPADDASALDAALRAALAAAAPMLDARRDAGFVRRCHGDLHLRNVCLIGGRPTPFDAIEFNEAIASIDVLYDLAFLLMDLEHRGLRPFANLALNRYLWRESDYGGLAMMPFFLACRAAVRAHVAATQAGGAGGAAPAAEARDYLALSAGFLRPTAPRLLAVGGLSGTGKSMLARRIAPAFGRAPGAVVLCSDVIRKRLLGVDPFTRLGPDGYAPEVTRRVYRTIRERAGEVLAGGHSVVADAVYARADERAGIEAAARDAGARFDGLWLEAPEPVRIARVEKRRDDASDATAAVAAGQESYETGDSGWRRLDAGGDPDATAALAQKTLNLNEKRSTLGA
jgi:hypothetical protein